MKQVIAISFWLLSVLMVATIMLSFQFSVSEALFFGSLFLPGAIFAKYAFSKITKEDKAGFVRDAAFISIGIIIGEVFLFMISAYIIIIMRHSYDFPDWPDLPSALQNPVFISVIISFLAVGSEFLDRWLEKKFPSGPKKITFLSDRRSVTLLTSEILYVESNDTITILHAAGGSSFKNRTPISQWESILDTEFVRIHRSFLVNRSAITAVDKDALYIGDVELPVSRKYKESVSRLS